MASESATQESTPQESSEPKPAAKATKKSAPKKRSTKKASVKKLAARKTTAKKSAPKKKAAKKRVAKKPVAAKKSAAKKAAVKKSAPKKRKAKKQPVAMVSKAQSIRDEFEGLGKKARPKDVIAALAVKGITVTSPQVSMTLKAAGLRRGKRRRKAQPTIIASKPSSNGHGFNLDELLKVKKLAEEIGGTAKVKELAATLERLIRI